MMAGKIFLRHRGMEEISLSPVVWLIGEKIGRIRIYPAGSRSRDAKCRGVLFSTTSGTGCRSPNFQRNPRRRRERNCDRYNGLYKYTRERSSVLGIRNIHGLRHRNNHHLYFGESSMKKPPKSRAVKAWAIKYDGVILPNWVNKKKSDVESNVRSHNYNYDFRSKAKIIRVEIRELPRRRKKS